jgi:hypothetical protein
MARQARTLAGAGARAGTITAQSAARAWAALQIVLRAGPEFAGGNETMFASLQAGLTEGALLFAALGALAGALAAFFYVPLVGRPLAVGLVALAAGLAAYDAGFTARGKLDHSGALAAQLAEAERQAAAVKRIAESADARERASADQAAAQNERIAAYEQELAQKSKPDQNENKPGTVVAFSACPALDRATCACRLSPGDVSSLRAIGRTDPAEPSDAAGAIRAARRRP